jgi:hypothetical protein
MHNNTQINKVTLNRRISRGIIVVNIFFYVGKSINIFGNSFAASIGSGLTTIEPNTFEFPRVALARIFIFFLRWFLSMGPRYEIKLQTGG